MEITVLMSLTFFMNMVSSNKNQKVKMKTMVINMVSSNKKKHKEQQADAEFKEVQPPPRNG